MTTCLESLYFPNIPSILVTVGTNKYRYKQYVNKKCAKECDILTYTLTIQNDTSSTAIGTAAIFNLVPCNGILLNNCFIINNTLMHVANPCVSINTPSIPIGATVTITYSVMAGCCGNCVINEPIAYVSGNTTSTPIFPNKTIVTLC